MSRNTIADLLFELRQKNIPESEYRGYIERHLEQKARMAGIPRKGHFELTPLCNFNCKMCYVHLNQEQLKGQHILSTEQWTGIMEQAIRSGIMVATLSGGECLTHPGFDAIYSYLIERGIQVYLLTNGFLLDQKFDLLEKYPPENIQVTLYGKDDAEYEAVTGHRGYEKVVSNILTVREMGLRVQVTITPNKYVSVDSYKAIMDDLYRMSIPFRLNMDLMVPREETGRDDGFSDLTDEDYITLYRYYKNLGTVETDNDFDYHQDEISVYNEIESSEIEPIENLTNRRGLSCGAGRSGFAVTWNGKMIPCMDFYDVQADLLTNSFEACWHVINEYCNNYQCLTECDTCKYSRKCIYCSPKHKTKDHTCDTRLCNKMKKLVEAGLL